MAKLPAYRVESVARAVMMAAIGVMAGAASFTHMHDWTMHNSPRETPEWFGWANAVVSELMPALALLEIRRRHRSRRSIGYPLAILIAAGLLSLAAQVAQANHSWSGRGLAALPAVGFIVLTKMIFSGLGPAAPAAVGNEEQQAPEALQIHESTKDERPDVDPTIHPAVVRPAVVASSGRPTAINGTVVTSR
jgi:peptidoglycan/LPS O-acetylase OafA/YrhL